MHSCRGFAPQVRRASPMNVAVVLIPHTLANVSSIQLVKFDNNSTFYPGRGGRRGEWVCKLSVELADSSWGPEIRFLFSQLTKSPFLINGASMQLHSYRNKLGFRYCLRRSKIRSENPLGRGSESGPPDPITLQTSLRSGFIECF